MNPYYKYLSLLLFLGFANLTQAQSNPQNRKDTIILGKDTVISPMRGNASMDNPISSEYEKDTAIKIPDVQSFFAGRDSGFLIFIRDNFQYPWRCQEEGIYGYVRLRFIVEVDGRITNISAIEETKSCPEFTTEAIRVMKKSPRWIPAQVNGRFVRSWRIIPIRLAIN